MKIRTVEFSGALASPEGPMPGGLPEVAFAGRSNVGKSSLINRLLGRTRTPIARVSSTPGKTQEVNFFRVDALGADDQALEFTLVDLPGYGYAKVPRKKRGAWKPLIEGYLRRSGGLRGVVQLIDSRHEPTPDDLGMVEFLAALGVPTLVVLTKVDKLKSAQRARRIESIASALNLEMEQILPFSSHTGEGREELLGSLEGLLGPDGADL
ncbi:MAG TPA: ribosome biogenesis GTP-binding protein YihA/YsxC [Longimicrobiales bacterium]|nr:ribosome biogenesis GTP-binding protein YihA/YsxC [Longimicrobiales bacterium]